MNNLLTCKYSNCNKYYTQPLFLPCSKNLCHFHIEELTNNYASKSIKCPFCQSNHELPEKGFPVNQDLVALLNLNLHLTDKEKDANELVKKFEVIMNDFSIINKDPEHYIFSYISNVRNKIDIERERLLLKINQISDDMLEKLKNFEEECKSNLIKIQPLSTDHTLHLEKMQHKYLKWKNQLLTPNLDQNQVNELINDINEMIHLNNDKLFDYKNILLNEKGCYFIPKCLDFEEDLFGEFKLDKAININMSEKMLEKGDLFYSRILTASQAIDLIKLCEFSLSDKFNLIYRASEMGFRSKDFHNRCDGIPRTLTIIKTKDGENIFGNIYSFHSFVGSKFLRDFFIGGYTEVAWDSADHSKEDRNAFIFSLVNQDQKPIKLNYDEADGYSIYCGSTFGPIFGGGNDFRIESDSNINKKSRSNLGCSYKHPLYLYQSKEAQNFLAGTYNFSVGEIEVYRRNYLSD